MARTLAKNYLALALLLCCIFLLVGAGCEKSTDSRGEKTGYEIDKVYERGPLTAHVRVDKGKMTIADTLVLELEAAVQPPYEVRMPKVGEVLENFGIVDWDNAGDRLDDNNRVVRSYRYRLEPFMSGTYAIPGFTFEFYDANSAEDKKYELSSEPIDIEVTSLLGEQRSELVIADIEDVVEMPEEGSEWWAWALGVVGIVSVGGLWLYLRRKAQVELVRIFKPAHEIAYERLHALVKQDLVKWGRVKEFYEHISDILRHYIEHRFSLRAPERTTEEFLIELQFTDVLSASDKEDLGEFLRHCDLVKFANMSPTAAQIQRTFDLVKDFIEKTKSDERRVDITEEVHAAETIGIGSG